MATQASSQPSLSQELRERLSAEVPEWEQLRRAMPALGLKPLPNTLKNKYGIGYDGPSDRGAGSTLAAYTDYLDAKYKHDTKHEIEVLLTFLKNDPAAFRYSGWAHSAASEILLGLQDSSVESGRVAKSLLDRYWRLLRNDRIEKKWKRLEQLKPAIDELDGPHAGCRAHVVRWLQGKFGAEFFREAAEYGSDALHSWVSLYREDPNCRCKCLTDNWLKAIFNSFELVRNRGAIHAATSVTPGAVDVEAVAYIYQLSSRTLTGARHALRPKRIKAKKS